MAEKKSSPKTAAPAAKSPAANSKKLARAAAKATPKKVQNWSSKAKVPATYMAPKNGIERRWYVVDADGLVLGRAASRIAFILRGKHKPVYTPHTDTGDFVVVINAEKIRLTGTKEDVKPYYRHTMHPGGLRTRVAKEVRARTPERLLEQAVKRMISRSPLGRKMCEKLKVYAGPVHPHQAQNPEALILPL